MYSQFLNENCFYTFFSLLVNFRIEIKLFLNNFLCTISRSSVKKCARSFVTLPKYKFKILYNLNKYLACFILNCICRQKEKIPNTNIHM